MGAITSAKMCSIQCYTFLFGFWTQQGDEFFMFLVQVPSLIGQFSDYLIVIRYRIVSSHLQRLHFTVRSNGSFHD